MQTVSIGFDREDGDFQILATLNNNDELISPYMFEAMACYINAMISHRAEKDCRIIERQDTPDYITLDEEI